MNLTAQFKDNYLAGSDCRLSTFRNNLATAGLPLSNAMILGISGSLVYCFSDGISYNLPCFVTTGISDQTLEGLIGGLNCIIYRGRMRDMADAHLQIPYFLEKKMPVNIAIHRQTLTKISSDKSQENSGFNFLEDANLGFHYVTLTEYDKNNNSCTLFETDTSTPIKISLDELEDIWFYDLKNQREFVNSFQLCDGQWYSILKGEISNEQVISSSIYGINKVLLNFFHSPHPTQMGLNALVLFQEEAHSWREGVTNVEHLCKAILLMQVTEYGLTGGGLGRKLYGYFLSELSKLTNDPELKSISYEFTHTAKKWHRFVRELSASIQYETEGFSLDFFKVNQTVNKYVDDIVYRENQQMCRLREWHTKINNKSANAALLSLEKYEKPVIK